MFRIACLWPLHLPPGQVTNNYRSLIRPDTLSATPFVSEFGILILLLHTKKKNFKLSIFTFRFLIKISDFHHHHHRRSTGMQIFWANIRSLVRSVNMKMSKMTVLKSHSTWAAFLSIAPSGGPQCDQHPTKQTNKQKAFSLVSKTNMLFFLFGSNCNEILGFNLAHNTLASSLLSVYTPGKPTGEPH